MSAFQEIKMVIVSATGLSKDALHIYVGLTVYLAGVYVFRSTPGSLRPWIAVVLVAIVLEVLDLRDDILSVGHWRWGASLHDLVNTIFWPTVLLFLARRGMLGGVLGARRDASSDKASLRE